MKLVLRILRILAGVLALFAFTGVFLIINSGSIYHRVDGAFYPSNAQSLLMWSTAAIVFAWLALLRRPLALRILVGLLVLFCLAVDFVLLSNGGIPHRGSNGVWTVWPMELQNVVMWLTATAAFGWFALRRPHPRA